MILEAGQALTEAASRGSITIAIPTAFLSSVVTLLGREALAAIIGKRKRNGTSNGGPKPGTADVCIKRGERIASMETETTNLKGDILRVEGKIDRLLERN